MNAIIIIIIVGEVKENQQKNLKKKKKHTTKDSEFKLKFHFEDKIFVNESQLKLIGISQRNICEKSAQYIFELYKMGSAPSTPSQEGNPWWSIENQTLELNPTDMNPNSETNAEQTMADNESVRADNVAVSSISESKTKNESIVAESTELNETNENNSKNSDENCASSSKVEQSNRNQNQNQNQTLEEFKEELRIKRELRKCAISELRNEMSNLRHELVQEKALNKKLMTEKRDCRCFMTNCKTETIEDQTDSITTSLRTQLSEVQYSLQLANADILSLTTELSVTKRQTQSLKDVVAATKQMLEIRETELNQVW